ncbi:hypothetical protein [Rosistilla carotiformis]|uniref:hypothetical protein n=1 Tax=Rosistilla carotiformis TaxID=2528017 RepID=UPI0011A37D97|nr:hypothetical protein [Rosistilla carotiformis]
MPKQRSPSAQGTGMSPTEDWKRTTPVGDEFSAIMFPVVIAWGILAIYLGRQQTRRAAAGEAD